MVKGERPSENGSDHNNPEKLISWTGLTRTAYMPLPYFRKTDFSKLRFLWPTIPIILNPGNVAVIIGGAIVLYPTEAGRGADVIPQNYLKDGKHHTPDQEALGELVKDLSLEGHKPISGEDADQLLEWGHQVGSDVKDHRDAKPDHWGGRHIFISPVQVLITYR